MGWYGRRLHLGKIHGVPVAWILPRSEQFLIGPLPGRYSISWRDFLGGDIEPWPQA